jgi:hypothetical protein
MAIRTCVDSDFLRGGSSLKRIPASTAGNGYFIVFWMDTFFHRSSPSAMIGFLIVSFPRMGNYTKPVLKMQAKSRWVFSFHSNAKSRSLKGMN